MGDYAPFYSGGVLPFSTTTSGAVTGGQVVVWSGSNTVAASGADSALVAGVAAHDAASGARLTVWPINNVIHELVASGAISALAGVVTDTNGQVKSATIATAAAAGTLIGTAVTAAGGAASKFRAHCRN